MYQFQIKSTTSFWYIWSWTRSDEGRLFLDLQKISNLKEFVSAIFISTFFGEEETFNSITAI